MADTSRLWDNNLALLEDRDAALASAIRASVSDPRFLLLPARNGTPVPAVRSSGGTAPLHSLYDPEREGQRLAEKCRDAGCVVVCGLGGGFHASALLQDPSRRAVLVVEKDAAVLRALLERVDFAPLFRDRRVSIVCGTGRISAALASSWNPALSGSMKTMALRSWCDVEPEFFRSATAAIQETVETIRADYGVQAHFGKRWFVNILYNLPLVRPAPAPLPVRSAMVTAAGPSLDVQIPELRDRRPDSLLIATDTSLPALLGRGIVPDAVLSIDCQIYGYHHFLSGLAPGATLYLDLASPPLLARLHPRPVFVAGGHPFARYIAAHLAPLPWLDTSGGNVAHAAVALARSLGASTIRVYGADFSYPQGKAYARGTYLYDYFRASQDRLAPAESMLLSFGLKNSVQERSDGKSIPTTALLLAYRDRFLRMMETMDADVVPVPGLGLPLTRAVRAPAAAHATGAGRAAGPWPPGSAPPQDWRGLLRRYQSGLHHLGDRLSDVTDLGLRDTLLPVAARLIKEGCAPGETALSEARRWVTERIRRVLEGSGVEDSGVAHE